MKIDIHLILLYPFTLFPSPRVTIAIELSRRPTAILYFSCKYTQYLTELRKADVL